MIRALRRARAAVLLALVPGIVGILLLRWPAAEGLERIGLDLLMKWRGPLPQPDRVCVVAIDRSSHEVLSVRTPTWPRDLHARLIRTLAKEGAKAIAFDVLFEDPGDPEQDEALIAAMEETGIVVIGATVEQTGSDKFNEAIQREPWEPFADAARRVADVNLPSDRDGVIRAAWPAPDGRPGLALAAYEIATGDESKRETGARFIDYYGRARVGIRTVSVYQALEPETHLARGYFRDKLVFVGLSEPAAAGQAPKDAFLTPFSGGMGETTYGVEIHATIAANLLDGRTFDLLAPGLETGLLLLLPVVALLVFAWLDPRWGVVALAGLAALPWATAHWAFTQRSLWLPTLIPSLIQLPLAYVVSLIWYYLTTVRERERVKRAFALYLSPEAARQIAENPSALNLGGEEIVATAMFTDIAGFTTVAESMSAHDVAAMLNRYFSEATGHVFETGGTLVKYIGDAVFAIWGAPVRQEDHAARACRAALALSGMSAEDLKTRIGVHTGPMLVGNLGSAQRFDYTAIGDAVNLAARIEGLNKHFGTRAIVSGDALKAAGAGFSARRLGRVRVVGRSEPVELFELRREGDDRESMERFAQGLAAFERGEIERADAVFESLGDDPPSRFYRGHCAKWKGEGLPAGWDGVITAESK